MEWNILVAYAFLLGLLIGSFLNVVILRLPKSQSLVFPSSHCTSCGTNIRFYDNIPVLSWILLRGKCRACKSSISSLYPTIELLMGILSVLIFWRIMPSASNLTWVNGAA
ncbi:MAG: prepilin peptidase, partial [Myxococcota bacterium]|nr:prepilin peptidase [Myxococcota bacterium]